MNHREIHVIYFYVHSYNYQVIAKILKICIKKNTMYILLYTLFVPNCLSSLESPTF